MKEVIRIKDQFYILANSSIADESSRVLKHADTFAVFDRHGDIRPLGFEEHGLYHEGTRYLSRLVLRVEGKSPLLLSSTVREDNDLLVVDLMNPDFQSLNGNNIQRGVIHFSRSTFLWKACFYERIRISNYGSTEIEFSISLEFGADYVDIFEVRGMKRKQRGSQLNPVVEEKKVTLSYKGLDKKVRHTRLVFDSNPSELRGDRAVVRLKLGPHQEQTFCMSISCTIEEEPPESENFNQAFLKVKEAFQSRHTNSCIIETSNEQFNDWLSRSKSDLNMMLTRTPSGLYPYAGIPWFNTVFGRDGIITAFETLWFEPEIARGVLSYLARNQATEIIAEQDAEPGKIIHEVRKGEMAALKEIPFGRYYGTIDATPLFVVLAGHYYNQTGDQEFIKQLWPNIERALAWIDTYGDIDQDGFVEYKPRSDGGLSQQGWKDSEDSVFHADGSSANHPIALCEVQGYVYEAKLKASQLAAVLGKKGIAEKLRKEAETLKERFLRAFWCEDLGMYALALDEKKRPCKVRSSNAGQCLFSGIASDEHASIMTGHLLHKSFFTGWGIRTLASSQARYNPMSYHNGSVWPHDNALIAFGMSRYRLKDAVMKILTGLFDASIFMDLHRLPELFCGFERRRGEGPTLYPVACEPQAWSSASVYLLLQACLGLSIQAPEKKIYFNHPVLPPFLQEVTLKNLKVGSSSIDISLIRHAQDVGVNVMRKDGDIEVVASK